jgi:hypothetical protein
MGIPTHEYELGVLDWVRAAVGDGLAILKKERAFTGMANAVKYVDGEQFPLRSRTVSSLVDNRLRKIVLETVSAMTDVRPIWNFETNDASFKPQAEILNKLTRSWWKNSLADRKLQTVLTFSCVGGSGYAYLKWNPELPGHGDIELIPMDPRNVIPIEPVLTDSIQDWRGVIIRQSLPVETVKQMYPLKSFKIGTTRGSWFEPMTKEVGSISNVLTAAWTTLTRGYEGRNKGLPNATDLFHIYVKDDAIHTGNKPKVMGPPGSHYSYIVFPVGSQHPIDGHAISEQEARLYPRGRYIVCTMDSVCEDGPNPYWHGNFPIVKFTLDPLPWSMLGSSMVNDLIPLQNALNEALRGVEDGMAQWLRRGVIADRGAIAKTTLEAIDTRKSGLKAYLNNNIGGQGFQIVDGPQYPDWYMKMIDYIKNEMDDISGVRGLQQLAQMKQMPSADTLEKFMDSLSPILKIRSRGMEVALGELAELLKVSFFQFYDVKRRFEILGPEGVTLEDFDYDPGSLVPSDLPGNSREDRASRHHRNFKFNVAPNTFLEVSHTEQKMLDFQMFRANILDPWTLWESMNRVNVGKPPAETIPERIVAARKLGLMEGPTPEMVMLQQKLMEMQMMMQIQMLGMQSIQGALGGGPPGGGGPGGPQAPPNSGVGPEGGRPPSGNQPPQLVQKDGGSRSVVSESGR